MESFLISKEDRQVDNITAAEVTSVYHSVQHAQSYRSSDCGSKLAPVIFLDSEIAKKMSCGRMKAASRVTDVLAPSSVESCLRELRTSLVQLPDLIKWEIQVKNNFGYSCKTFYSYALKQKALLEAAHSNKKYKFRNK
ncbi:hypothetical protein G5714_023753 [Onychostoma macrolepis]|uniref:Uncharacterized protein n=1 Tax=Onychostoma macrolepis TaxID=369639 RepID=A0A7J6BM55_9TELE|nr:hypothetical protein G5714_023753 [Onychostoma macrolepis]